MDMYIITLVISSMTIIAAFNIMAYFRGRKFMETISDANIRQISLLQHIASRIDAAVTVYPIPPLDATGFDGSKDVKSPITKKSTPTLDTFSSHTEVTITPSKKKRKRSQSKKTNQPDSTSKIYYRGGGKKSKSLLTD
jgi:hypothetical protein